MMLKVTGVAEANQIKTRFPPLDYLIKPKAIIECYEDIPCNPCSTSCPFQAIHIGVDINQQPKLNVELCTGCCICVHSCPGLAIMVAQSLEDKIRFKIPYEFLPIPKVGEVWNAINRSGKLIGKAIIEKVINTKKQDQTLIIQVLVDKDLLYDFVTIRGLYE